jgi:hypothetical protein
MALSNTLDDFEDGDLNGWTVNKWTTSTNQAYSGSYSGSKTSDSVSEYEMARRGFGESVRTVKLWYYCTKSSWGGAYQLRDGNQNVVTAAGNTNADWTYLDGSNPQGTSIGNYTTWTSIEFEMDYDNGWVDIIFSDSSNTKTYNVNMNTNNPVKEIRVININNNSDLINGKDQNQVDYHEYTDLITYETTVLPVTIDGTSVKEITIDGNSVQSLSIDGNTIF